MSEPRTRKTWNKDSIGVLLEHSDEALRRAIVFLYRQQTEAEKAAGATTDRNNRGFNAADAKQGVYMAKWILQNPDKPRNLTGKWVDIARNMVKKYAGQLADFANAEPQLSKPSPAVPTQRPMIVPAGKRTFIRA